MSVEGFEKALSAWRAAHSPFRTKALPLGADARTAKGRCSDPQKSQLPSISELERSHEPPKPE